MKHPHIFWSADKADGLIFVPMATLGIKLPIVSSYKMETSFFFPLFGEKSV